MRVRHLGNTANNAYYNVQILDRYTDLESELPVAMYGLRHAISAPAWEAVEFEVPDAAWIAAPDWSRYPDAVAVNTHYTDIEPPATAAANAEQVVPAEEDRVGMTTALRTRLFGPLRGQRWAQPLIELRDRQVLASRPQLGEPEHSLNLLYGSASMFVAQVPDSARRTVALEHGTVRWIADGNREEKAYRDAYRTQLQRSMHLWVTNLDPRTLEVAEDIVPGRWSAFPHPFVPDPRVPFAESTTQRAELLRATSSQFLVLLPASQNWTKDHDKGSNRALAAFAELRRAGVDIGLIAVEWGHQVAQSKQYLDDAGVGGNVVWLQPMARFALQKMMANVDVVWDQFGLAVFGGLAIKAVEQGTPLVSRGLEPMGERFIDGPVPWLAAATTDEIVQQTTSLLEETGRDGRSAVVERTRRRYRSWLLRNHSPLHTAALQQQRYSEIVSGGFQPGSVQVDEWARRIRAGEAGEA
jgi:hypothetical protein